MGVSGFITGCNEVVAKVMFLHVCVILFIGGVSGQGEHPRTGRPPPEHTPPPGADTPPSSRHPPRMHTPAYGQRAAGTHSTGMHSCRYILSLTFARTTMNLPISSAINVLGVILSLERIKNFLFLSKFPSLILILQ